MYRIKKNDNLLVGAQFNIIDNNKVLGTFEDELFMTDISQNKKKQKTKKKRFN